MKLKEYDIKIGRYNQYALALFLIWILVGVLLVGIDLVVNRLFSVRHILVFVIYLSLAFFLGRALKIRRLNTLILLLLLMASIFLPLFI